MNQHNLNSEWEKKLIKRCQAPAADAAYDAAADAAFHSRPVAIRPHLQ